MGNEKYFAVRTSVKILRCMGPHPSNEAKKEWIRKTHGNRRPVVVVIVDVEVEVEVVVVGSTREVMVGGGGTGPVEQPGIGTTRSNGAPHALGYEHPEIGVGAGVVSPVLYHPFILRSFVAVYVGVGRV